LMALGLSVVFGVVRIVNFAHGELMTAAMYCVVVVCATWQLDHATHGSRSSRFAASDIRGRMGSDPYGGQKGSGSKTNHKATGGLC